MKFYLFIIISLAATRPKLYSQDYKEQFKADICACFQNKMVGRQVSQNIYKQCFKETIPKYATLIDASIVEENSTIKYRKGQQLRLELIKKLQYELVYSCDTYFNALEDERERKFAANRSMTYLSDLKELDENVAMHPNSQSYYLRAQAHFNLGNLKKAEADVLESIKLNLAGDTGLHLRKEKILLGWILERQERYNEAATCYKEIYFGGIDTETPVLQAIANRKSGGSFIETPKLFNVESKIKTTERTRTRNESVRQRVNNLNEEPVPSKEELKIKRKKEKDSVSLKKLFKIN